MKSEFAVDTPIVYLITKGEASAGNFADKRREILDIVRSAVESGVSLIQLREKQLSARLVYELAVDAAGITRGTATKLLINDRPDIAFAAGADGVQLTANSLSAAIVRKAFSPEMIIGVSTHSIEEVKRAAGDGADFAVFGPVFPTPGKGEAQGLSALREACEIVRPFPIVAIGGINANNYVSVLDAGAAGYAAIRWLNAVRSLYSPKFQVGRRVQIAQEAQLQQFHRDWKYHHPLQVEQLAHAGRATDVKNVAFYHGGDVLYELLDVPGIWHEQCLRKVDHDG